MAKIVSEQISYRFRSIAGIFRGLLILLAVIFTGAAIYLDWLNNSRFEEQQRNRVADKTRLIRASLEGNINSNIQTVLGLIAAIRTDPNLGQERYAQYARHLFHGKTQLRNIGAAPDMVIRYMYPIKGNEAAIGLDYRKNEAQRRAAEYARDSGELIVAGPVTLAQGGQAFIGRIPVFLEGNAEFWGLISAVIDLEAFYRESGLTDPGSGLDIALRGKDAMGPEGDVFFGSPEVFKSNPVVATVSLPAGSWQIAAIPTEGWPNRADNAFILRLCLVLAGVFTLIPALATLKLLNTRELHEKSLLLAKEQAEAAARAKSEFLAVMSHEIRTPLNGVMGMLNLMSRGSLEEKQRHKLKIALSSADSLLSVINDILDFSKVDAGKLDLESTNFDLEALVKEVVEIMMLRAQEKELEIKVDLSKVSQKILRGDPARLRQIFLNLISNAIKFTENGFVRVRCTVEPDAEQLKLLAEVEDTGIGIPLEKQKTLFEPFTQVDASTTRQYGGTGLGLAICHKLCSIMGGSIAVRSSIGGGSCFSFNVYFEQPDQ